MQHGPRHVGLAQVNITTARGRGAGVVQTDKAKTYCKTKNTLQPKHFAALADLPATVWCRVRGKWPDATHRRLRKARYMEYDPKSCHKFPICLQYVHKQQFTTQFQSSCNLICFGDINRRRRQIDLSSPAMTENSGLAGALERWVLSSESCKTHCDVS